MTAFELYFVVIGPAVALLGGLMIWAAGELSMRWDDRRAAAKAKLR